MPALGAHRTTSKSVAAPKANVGKTKAHGGDAGVVEPDNRIVFAVLAVGMLVGALLTTPAKPSAHQVKLKTPATTERVAAVTGK